MNPDLYLDVDGVLVLKEGEINDWLFRMLWENKDRFARIYWLSTWTRKGDAEDLYERYPTFQLLEGIPLAWNRFKTEAIDWSRPLVWIEDGILDHERADFYTKSKAGQSIWEVRLGGTL